MPDDIELERGLCYFVENQREFERRCLSVEKQVAFGYEAGFQAGRTELKAKVSKVFKGSNIDWEGQK
jgi:hypothetical protein